MIRNISYSPGLVRHPQARCRLQNGTLASAAVPYRTRPKGWGVGGVKLRYEPTKDILTLTLRENAPIIDVAEDAAGTVFGYDRQGELVVIEIFDATQHVHKLKDIEWMLDQATERILGDLNRD